jgi:hypothetical protein
MFWRQPCHLSKHSRKPPGTAGRLFCALFSEQFWEIRYNRSCRTIRLPEGIKRMAKAEIALGQHRPAREDRNRSGAFYPSSPQVLYSTSAQSLLTLEVQEVLDGMLILLLREIREAAGVGPRLEVYSTLAADEMEAHLVISAGTDLPAEEAFALWDHLGDAVQKWTTTLSELQEEIALSIAIEVLWSVDRAAL